MASKNRQTAAVRGGPGAAEPASALAKARQVLDEGNVRRAREYAQEAASTGPEAERGEARALLDRLAPDRTVLLVIGGVLLLIVLAAWAAILRTH